MRHAELAENVKALIQTFPDPQEFINEFLLTFSTPNGGWAILSLFSHITAYRFSI